MLTRRRVLLHLLAGAAGQASRLQIMKWSFLLAQETGSGGGPSFYQFVPYQHGPFSFSMYRELQSMEDVNLVESVGSTTCRLTELGQDAAATLPASLQSDIDLILDTYGRMTNCQLVDNVHARYPWFAINSDAGDPALRPSAQALVYTAGYQMFPVDGFLNGLLHYGVERIIDVRRNPVSRVYGFHRSTLARLAGYMGIDYHHFPELGIDGRERHDLTNESDYEHLFSTYQRTTLVDSLDSVRTVGDLMLDRPSALLCFEKCPEQCHRSHLAACVAGLIDRPIRHLELAR